MDLVARATGAADLARALAASRDAVLVWRCTDADTAVAAAALAGEGRHPHLGLWLEVSAGYPAALAARDVKTLAALVGLGHVVIGADERARAHAEVVEALLGGGPVALTNEVATIVGAYNRPAPREPVTVWAHETARLVGGGQSLGLVAAGSDALGEWRRYGALSDWTS